MRRLPPFLPEPFGAEDARWLADQGFNSARLGLMYEAVEPELDTYDDQYIGRMVEYSRLLADHGFFNTIDFHQDSFARLFGGDGFPSWAVANAPDLEERWAHLAVAFDQIDCGLLKFMLQMEFNPILRRSWDHFWSNAELENGRGLQDQFIRACAHVLSAFSSEQARLIGYSPLNEPVVGNLVAPLGDHIAAQRGPFYQRWLDAARKVDPDGLVYLFSDILTVAGNGKPDPVNVRHLAHSVVDENIGFERHHYNGSFGGGDPVSQRAQYEEDEELAREVGLPFVVNEFSASDNDSNTARDVDYAGELFLSWMMWSYYPEGEICCSDSGLLLDDSLPASDDNVKPGKADALVTPYPQAVAGTPLSFHFDRDTATMSLEYSTEAADARLRSDAATVIFVPRRVYPTGYRVEVEGARVISDPTAPWVELLANDTSLLVSVRITGRSGSFVALPSEYKRP
ncbi:glycoside hydrolase family 5 protein [Diaminobutyricibacter sp. McL0608]|uniref:glycoside hydrolase family 5 protein n=1 Tax=Leifsonia sp. McL0608 TaxID=3143537 RepID=UPI0031F2F3CB